MKGIVAEGVVFVTCILREMFISSNVSYIFTQLSEGETQLQTPLTKTAFSVSAAPNFVNIVHNETNIYTVYIQVFEYAVCFSTKLKPR